MQILKKSLLGGAATLLFGILALFGFSLGLLQVFGNAGSIKSALDRSGIYQSVVEDALKQAEAGQGESEPGSIPLDRPEVQNIIKTAASPELLQTKTENVLDAVYAWVRGETPELAFSLEVGDIKAGLANGIEQYAIQYASSLPKCAPGATADIANDLFNATCLPEGAKPKQLAAQAKNDFLNGDAFKETTLSADTIKTGNGETLAQTLQTAPNIYRYAAWSVYGSGLLALLLAVGVVVLSATWRSGLKKVSFVFIGVGLLGVVASIVAGAGMSRLAELAKEPLEQSAMRVVEILLGDLRSWWLWFGVALMVAGVAALVVLRFTRPSLSTDKDKEGEAAMPEPAGETQPPQATPISTPPAVADQPKPKPPKRLIQ